MSFDLSSEEKIMEQLNDLDQRQIMFAQEIKQQRIKIEKLETLLSDANELLLHIASSGYSASTCEVWSDWQEKYLELIK